MDARFSKVCLLGMGLMGASAAAALKKRSAATYIEAVDARLGDAAHPHTDAKYRDASERGWIDGARARITEALEGADALLIALPLHRYASYFNEFRPDPQLLITDVGSAKACVAAAAVDAWGSLSKGFVPAHPIAGAPHSGHECADPDLFEACSTFLCPHRECADWAIAAAESFWLGLGVGHIEYLSCEAHDHLLARTSHLPQLIAYGLARTVGRLADEAGYAGACGPGIRGATRLATSDPGLWVDIARQNQRHVIDAIDAFIEQMKLLRQHIDAADDSALEKEFAEAVRVRQNIARSRPGDKGSPVSDAIADD